MKRTVLIIMISSLIALTGCQPTEDNKDSALNQENQPVTVDRSKMIPEKEAMDTLKQLANQEFLIQGEHLGQADDDTIIGFGKAFVNLYNGAVEKQEKVSFETYISNTNLRRFTDKMLELTQKQDLKGHNAESYGMKNEFKETKLQHIGSNLCHLELLFQFEGSVLSSKMLITSENKSLKIVDVYFGTKDGADTFATGHPAVRKVGNPHLWDNEEWVQDVLDKLKDFEERLDS